MLFAQSASSLIVVIDLSEKFAENNGVYSKPLP